MIYEDISEEIIGAAYEVHDQLGFGFLEAVYGNALYLELKERGLKCECQKNIDVFYKDKKVGHYIADMLVEDKIIVELKAVSEIRDEHKQQLLNYLVATQIQLGLLINFGHSVEVKRLINTSKRNRRLEKKQEKAEQLRQSTRKVCENPC